MLPLSARGKVGPDSILHARGNRSGFPCRPCSLGDFSRKWREGIPFPVQNPDQGQSLGGGRSQRNLWIKGTLHEQFVDLLNGSSSPPDIDQCSHHEPDHHVKESPSDDPEGYPVRFDLPMEIIDGAAAVGWQGSPDGKMAVIPDPRKQGRGFPHPFQIQRVVKMGNIG